MHVIFILKEETKSQLLSQSPVLWHFLCQLDVLWEWKGGKFVPICLGLLPPSRLRPRDLAVEGSVQQWPAHPGAGHKAGDTALQHGHSPRVHPTTPRSSHSLRTGRFLELCPEKRLWKLSNTVPTDHAWSHFQCHHSHRCHGRRLPSPSPTNSPTLKVKRSSFQIKWSKAMGRKRLHNKSDECPDSAQTANPQWMTIIYKGMLSTKNGSIP